MHASVFRRKRERRCPQGRERVWCPCQTVPKGNVPKQARAQLSKVGKNGLVSQRHTMPPEDYVPDRKGLWPVSAALGGRHK